MYYFILNIYWGFHICYGPTKHNSSACLFENEQHFFGKISLYFKVDSLEYQWETHRQLPTKDYTYKVYISCHVPPPSNSGNWRFRLGLLQKTYKHPGVADGILGEVLHPNNIFGMFLEHILVELSKVFQSCPSSLVWCFQSSKETNTYKQTCI